MKKRIINVILILCALTVISGAVAVAVLNSRTQQEQDVQATHLQEEEYLLLNSLKKAQQKENAVWLEENSDTVFDVNSKSFKKTISNLGSYSFDTVYVKPKLFSSDKGENTDSLSQIQKLEDVIGAIKEKGKKCALAIDSSFLSEDYSALFSLCDKLVITGIKEKTASQINEITASLKSLLNQKQIKIKTEVFLTVDYAGKEKLDFSLVDSVYLPIKDEKEISSLNSWAALLKDSDCFITSGFYFDKKQPCDTVLKLVYELDSNSKISVRCFSSFKAVSENKLNCFGSVNEYINEGIVPELAFRKLSVIGYNGETVKCDEPVVQITVTGSNVFPFVIGSQQYYSDKTGSKKITLQLKEGENAFTILQNGEKLVYKAEYSFEGELIESIFPADALSVSPGEEIEVMVIAYSLSEVTVKLGAQQFETEADEKEKPCYTAFRAKIKMPSSYEELSSVGGITVVATHNGESVQKKGAVIKAFQGVVNQTTTTQPYDSETNRIDNYIPSWPTQKYDTNETLDTTHNITTNAITQPVTVMPSVDSDKKLMCVITAPYADTWRLVDNDDTYTPYYTTLCQGTMDYITGESSAYNSDDEKEVYFYELASGRKVRKETAQVFETAAYADNKMSFVSTEAENGTVKLKIKTDWKVPYALNYTPQNYFSAYGKQFNVSSFTADCLEFIFYHTVSAQGDIDVSGSDVISSGTWSVSSGGKTAKLILKLKKPGEYYGSNLSYDENGNMVITVNNKPKTLQGSVIMLDPGHGGTEPGAVGIGSAVLEKDVNLAVAHQTKMALEEMGATVIMTRYGNDTLTLEQRKAIMRQYKPDLFVAIHSNGSHNTQEKGTSAYYFKPFSRTLANNIYEELLSVYKNRVYAGQVELYDEISDGTIYYPFSVTRVEECPSVLVEVGFMTNDDECYELINQENQKSFGRAIAMGIRRTIEQ